MLGLVLDKECWGWMQHKKHKQQADLWQTQDNGLLENPYEHRLLSWLLLPSKKRDCKFKITAVIDPRNYGVSLCILLFSFYAFNMLTVFHRINSFSASIYITGAVLCQ